MYGNFGVDESEQYDRFKDFYDGLLGAAPTPTDDGFQARQMQVPALAQGLFPLTQQLSDLGEDGSAIAENMAQTAQQTPAGNGQNRIAQQRQAAQNGLQAANQAQAQQDANNQQTMNQLAKIAMMFI